MINAAIFAVLMMGGAAITSQAPEPTLEEALANVARDMAPTLPQRLDPSTTLVKVSTSGRTWTFHYALTERATREQIVNFFGANGLRKGCADPDMRALMLDGVTYAYEYTSPYVESPVTIAITDEYCRAQGL